LIKNLIIAAVAIFILQRGISAWASASEECLGWNCAEVECKEGYAVRLPDGSYLPCDRFDDYINGDKSVVVK
jgi:hypothetical protein